MTDQKEQVYQRWLKSMERRIEALEKEGASKEELDLFGRGRIYLGLIEGDIDEGSLLSGQIAGLIREIKPVRVIIEEMVAEAEAIIKTAGRRNSCG